MSPSPNWQEFIAALNASQAEFNSRFDQIIDSMDKLELRVVRNSEKLEQWVNTLNSDAKLEHSRIKVDCEERIQTVDERVSALYGYSRWFGAAIVIGLIGLIIDLAKNYILR